MGLAGKQLAFTNAAGAMKYGSHISTCVRLYVHTHTHTHTHVCTGLLTPPTHGAHDSEGAHYQSAGVRCICVYVFVCACVCDGWGGHLHGWVCVHL